MPASIALDTFNALRFLPHAACRLACALELSAWTLNTDGVFTEQQISRELKYIFCNRSDLKCLVDNEILDVAMGTYRLIGYTDRNLDKAQRAKTSIARSLAGSAKKQPWQAPRKITLIQSDDTILHEQDAAKCSNSQQDAATRSKMQQNAQGI